MNRIDRILNAINNPDVDAGGLTAAIGEVASDYVDMSDSMRALLLRDLGEETRLVYEEVKRTHGGNLNTEVIPPISKYGPRQFDLLGYRPQETPEEIQRFTQNLPETHSQLLQSNDPTHQELAKRLINTINKRPKNYGGYLGSFIDYINGFLSQKGKNFSFSPERAKELSSGSPFNDTESGHLRSIGIEPRHLETMAQVQNYGDVANLLQRHFAPGWMVMAYGSETNRGDIGDYLSQTGVAFTMAPYGYDWRKQSSATEGRWIPSSAGNYVYSTIYAAGRAGQKTYKEQTALENAVRDANFGGLTETSPKVGSEVIGNRALQQALGVTLAGRSVSKTLFEQIAKYMGVQVDAGATPTQMAEQLLQYQGFTSGTSAFNPDMLMQFIRTQNEQNPEMLTAVQEVMRIARDQAASTAGTENVFVEDSSRGEMTGSTFEELTAKLTRVPYYDKSISNTPLPFFVKKGQNKWFEIVNGIPNILGEAKVPPLKWATPSKTDLRVMADAVTHSRYNDPQAKALFARYDIDFTPHNRAKAITMLGEMEDRTAKDAPLFLPKIPEGYTRLAHVSNPDIYDMISSEGLKVGADVGSTTSPFSSNLDLEKFIRTGQFGAFDRTAFGSTIYLFDVPEDIARGVAPSPASTTSRRPGGVAHGFGLDVIPPEYFIGALQGDWAGERGFIPGSFRSKQAEEARVKYADLQQPVLTQSDLQELRPFLQQMESLTWTERRKLGEKNPSAYRLYKAIVRLTDYESGSLGGTESSEWETPHGDFGDMPEMTYDGQTNALWGQGEPESIVSLRTTPTYKKRDITGLRKALEEGEITEEVYQRAINSLGARYTELDSPYGRWLAKTHLVAPQDVFPGDKQSKGDQYAGKYIGYVYDKDSPKTTKTMVEYGTEKKLTNREWISPEEVLQMKGIKPSDTGYKSLLETLRQAALRNRMGISLAIRSEDNPSGRKNERLMEYTPDVGKYIDDPNAEITPREKLVRRLARGKVVVENAPVERIPREEYEGRLDMDEATERLLAIRPLMGLLPELDLIKSDPTKEPESWLIQSARSGKFIDANRPRRRHIFGAGEPSRPDWDINPNINEYFNDLWMQQHGYEGISITESLHSTYGLQGTPVRTSQRVGMPSSPRQVSSDVDEIMNVLMHTESIVTKIGDASEIPLYYTAADRWLSAIFGYAETKGKEFPEKNLEWWKRKTLSGGISPTISGLSVDVFGTGHLDPNETIDLTRPLPGWLAQTEPSTRKSRAEYLRENFWRVTSRPFSLGGRSGYDLVNPDELTAMLSMTSGRVDVTEQMMEEALSGETSVLRGELNAVRTTRLGMRLFSGLRGQQFEFASMEQKAYGRVTRNLETFSGLGKVALPFELLERPPRIGITEDVIKLLPGTRAKAPEGSALDLLRERWLQGGQVDTQGRKPLQYMREEVDKLRGRLPYDMFMEMRNLDKSALTDEGMGQAITRLWNSMESGYNPKDQVLRDFMLNFFGQGTRRLDDYQTWLGTMSKEDYSTFSQVWGPLQYGLVQSDQKVKSRYSELREQFEKRYKSRFGEEMIDPAFKRVYPVPNEAIRPSPAERMGKGLVSFPEGQMVDYQTMMRRAYSWGNLSSQEQLEIQKWAKASAPGIPLITGFEHEHVEHPFPQRTPAPQNPRPNFDPAIIRFGEGRSTILLAPTGSGKSQAMIEAAKVGIENQGKMVTIITSPTAALANQTAQIFKRQEGYIQALAFHSLGDPGEAATDVEKQNYALQTGQSMQALQESLVYENGRIVGWKANHPPLILSMSEAKAGSVLSGNGEFGNILRQIAEAGGLQELNDEAHGFFDPHSESLPSTLNIRQYANVPVFATTATMTERQARALEGALDARTWYAIFGQGAPITESLDFGTNFMFDYRTGQRKYPTVYDYAAEQYFRFASEIGHNPITLGIFGAVNDIMPQYNPSGPMRSIPGMTPEYLMQNPAMAENRSYIWQALEAELGRRAGSNRSALPPTMRFFRDPARVAPIKSESDALETMITTQQPFPERLYAMITAGVGGAGLNIPNLELVQNFANQGPIKMRQAQGRLRGIADTPTMVANYLSPQFYYYQEQSATNTYDLLSNRGQLTNIFDEMLLQFNRSEARNPMVHRDWKRTSSIMDAILGDVIGSHSAQGKRMNEWESGLLMRAVRESGVIGLSVQPRYEDFGLGMGPTFVGEYMNWSWRDQPSGRGIVSGLMAGRYRNPENPAEFVGFNELLQSIPKAGREMGDMGRELVAISQKATSRMDAAKYLREYINNFFGNELIRPRASAPGFEQFGAVMHDASGREIRINEDTYLAPAQAVMGDITLSRIERAKLEGFRLTGTWQKQPEGARNAAGGLASADDMALPGITQITDGTRSETIHGTGRRMIARATDFRPEGGGWGPYDPNWWNNNQPPVPPGGGNTGAGRNNNPPNQPPVPPTPPTGNTGRPPDITIHDLIISHGVTFQGNQQNQGGWNNFTGQAGQGPGNFYQGGPQGQQGGPQGGPWNAPWGQAQQFQFNPQTGQFTGQYVQWGQQAPGGAPPGGGQPPTTPNFGGNPPGGAGQPVAPQLPPAQQGRAGLGRALGALSGIYWAQRWWDIATGGVQQDIAGMAGQDFAPPALLGDRGTRYGAIVSGAGTRMAIAREAQQRGAYEEYGGITDLAFASSRNESLQRMRAAGSVSAGMAFGGIELGSSLSQMGYFAQMQGGAWGQMGATLGRVGTGLAVGGLALGAINVLGQAGFELYNTGALGNQRPEVPMSWGEVTRQIDKGLTLGSIKDQIAAQKNREAGIENPITQQDITSATISSGFASALSGGAYWGPEETTPGFMIAKAQKQPFRPENITDEEAIAQLSKTDPEMAYYFAYKGEPEAVKRSRSLANSLALTVGGNPTDYIPAMTRLGRLVGGAVPNEEQVLGFGTAAQRQGYGFQEYISMAEGMANQYGYLGGTRGQQAIVTAMQQPGLTTYGLDRMQENATLFQGRYASLTNWLPQSIAAGVLRAAPQATREWTSGLAGMFYQAGMGGFDVNKEYTQGFMLGPNGESLGRTPYLQSFLGLPNYNIPMADQRRETYGEMVGRMTSGLTANQMQAITPVVSTLLQKYPQYTEGALGVLSPIVSGLGNEGGAIFGNALQGNLSAQAYAANFRPDIMRASGQMYYAQGFTVTPQGNTQNATAIGNPWNWMDRSGNQIYQTSGQGFLSLGLGLANQGIVSQNIRPFQNMLGAAQQGAIQSPEAFLAQNYGVTDQGLAQSFLGGGLRQSQEYMIQQQRANQWAGIGLQYQQIANQRQYLWGNNQGGTWNAPTAGSMWGLENQQRQLGYQSQMASFDYSRTVMDTQNAFATQQEAITGQRMAANQAYQRWNIGFNYQGMMQQRQWTREDWQFQDTTRALSFSDSMTDVDEAIRRSSGYQRRVLLRQKERMGRDFGLEEGQIEKGRDRQQEVWAREDERYKKEKAYAEELMSLDSKQFDLQKTQRQTFYELESKNLSRNIEEYQKQFALQEKMIALSREYQASSIDISEKLLGINTANLALEQQYEDLVRKVTQQYSDWAGEVNNIASNEPSKLIMQSITAMLNNMSGMNNSTIDALSGLMRDIAAISPTQAAFLEQIFGDMR